MVQIPKERLDLFGKILVTILSRLGHAGEIAGYKDEGENIIFQFRPNENLDTIYPDIQDNGYDIIMDTVNSKDLSIRKHDGNLELMFPRVVVFMARAIMKYNTKLEFQGENMDENEAPPAEALIEQVGTAREWSTRELSTFVACGLAVGLLIGAMSAKVSLLVYGCVLLVGWIMSMLCRFVIDCIHGDA